MHQTAVRADQKSVVDMVPLATTIPCAAQGIVAKQRQRSWHHCGSGYSTRRSRPTRSIKPTARSMAAGGSSACHCPHAAQTFPFHRIHLRSWRMAALGVHWPFTITIPGPQPSRTCIIELSGLRSGARVIACDVVAAAKAKPTRAMSLIILFLPAGAFPAKERAGEPSRAPLRPANSTTLICIKQKPFAISVTASPGTAQSPEAGHTYTP
jgi:hypothetical protein